MGIVRDAAQARQVAVDVAIPFAKEPQASRLRSAAIGVAAQWFLERGYMPSIPVEAARYDLVVESDTGLQRVQVKTTTHRDRGRWVVEVCRRAYQKDRPQIDANGKRVRVGYDLGDVDWFFILAGDGSMYLIPTGILQSLSLVLDVKYAKYRLSRCGGTLVDTPSSEGGAP